ncbi:MAG: hypothetical protein M1827_006239 [Pycnora praestabilis]|nr:MAG: hypothetical protein M1827_006239 [Pycnora praestabilis]
MAAITVTPLPLTKSSHDKPSHHLGDPPTAFQNPWPSFVKSSPWGALQTRFSKDRNFVPVPPRDQLVAIRKPDWGVGAERDGKTGLKATWIGHATFLVETTSEAVAGVGGGGGGILRGVRVLFDPLWSERTSPSKWVGPKRYTPVPCPLEEVPEVDLVLISHNHYDHMDIDTIRELYRMRKGHIHFLCALGNASWFHSTGIQSNDVTELDWWHGVRVDIAGVGSVKLTCTPSQHNSGRTPWDMGSTLWCSWVVEEIALASVSEPQAPRTRKLFFSGDTGYRAMPCNEPSKEFESSQPHCPAFAEIGQHFGPFDLALLPIGLYSPRSFMSSVHCAPEDSVCIHKDIQSKKSIGMHWGTVRGGLSGQYEDVTEPPKRWKESAEREGLVWGQDVGLLDIGETLIVE